MMNHWPWIYWNGTLTKTPFLQLVGRCPSAVDALAKLEDETVDVLFLDIQMPELSGMELSRTLTQGPKVIFTTAFEEYALEGFKVSALDYLLKPFSYEEFLTAARKAQQWFERPSAPLSLEEGFIFVKSEYKIRKIPLDQLLYVEGLKDYVKIFMVDQAKTDHEPDQYEVPGRETAFAAVSARPPLVYCQPKPSAHR